MKQCGMFHKTKRMTLGPEQMYTLIVSKTLFYHCLIGSNKNARGPISGESRNFWETGKRSLIG